MNMAELEFFKGPYDNLAKVPIKEGQLLFTTGDKKRILLDIDNKTRAEIASPMIVTFTITDLTITPMPLKADTLYADIMEAANAGRIVYAFVLADEGGPLFGQLVSADSSGVNFTACSGVDTTMHISMKSDSDITAHFAKLLGTNDHGDYYDASSLSIKNVGEPVDDFDAVTRQYTDNSTPTFIYLEEQDGVIQSQTTDLDTLKIALISQTGRYIQTNKSLYKAIKCYAVLDGNCYDLVYSYLYDTQEPGKSAIVKGTFYAITSEGLNKLNVVIDEDNNVTWTKEAQGIASEQFVVTMTKEADTWKSDKTPAEIAAASQTGKQIVLKRQWNNKTETAYLVSVTDESADFCFVGTNTNTDLEQDIPISSDMFVQEWATITADKAAKIHREAHSPVFMIQDNGTEWFSIVSPYHFLNASLYGPASNVYLNKDGEILSGVVVQTSEENSTNYFHIYFPNYAKGKLYDLKWNKDENPSTYTLTESSLGAEGPMIVTFTVTDPTTFECTADKTYEEVDSAYKKGIPIYGKAVLGKEQAFLSCSYLSNRIYFTGQAGYNKTNMYFMGIELSANGGNGYSRELMGRINPSENDWGADNWKIKNLGSPIDDSDAATKGYADKILTTAKSYADNILTAGNNDSVVIKSSTPNSTKKFCITVDDAGTITATEV